MRTFPDLRGKSVLDVAAWDGFFSFEAERLGADRVIALDHLVWELDIAACMAYWQECNQHGVKAEPGFHERFHRPSELIGKRGFDTAHRLLGSRVESVVAKFMETDLDALGTFDVVLFVGLLNHLENPFAAIRRVAQLTKEVAVIETEAAEFPGAGNRPLCEFFPDSEMNNDPSDWWNPNLEAILGMCRAAGFKKTETIVASPGAQRARLRRKYIQNPLNILTKFRWTSQLDPVRYRALVKAHK